MKSSTTTGKRHARPRARVPVLAPLAVLGLSALILALVVLSGCSGSDDGRSDADAVVPDVPDVADVPDTGDEIDAADAEPEVACEKPNVVIQAPEAGKIYDGKPRVKIQASHPCGIATVRVKLDYTGTVAKSQDGADIGLIEICTVENDNPLETQFEDCKLVTVFPDGSHDAAAHDISGDDLPDGPVKIRVSATAACDGCTTTAGASVSVILDNHGPDITLLSPKATSPENPECVKDELYIELWVEDKVSGMAATGALDVSVDGDSIAKPDTADATVDKPYVIHHHLEGVTDGSTSVRVTAEDASGNESEVEVDVCVALLPTYRIVQKVGPRDAQNEFLNTETRWIDYGKFEIDGDLTPVVLLATRSGVYGSLLTAQGLPTNFVQLTNIGAEFVRAMPSKRGYPFALVVVELVGNGEWQLAVYEDPFSVDGHPAEPNPDADLEVVGDGKGSDVSDAAPADVLPPPTYDWGLQVEAHPVKGAVTAVWMGEVVDLADDDVSVPDVIVGTAETTTGLQIFRGDEDGGGAWFVSTPIEVPSVELTESIAVGNMDGDPAGLLDITIGRTGGGSYQGFKQTLQSERGKFSWTQNHVPTCADPSFEPSDLPGLDVAMLIDEEPGVGGASGVPEIVAVSSELNTITVLRRKMSGDAMSHTYSCAPTTFVSAAPPAPTLLVGSQPTKVLILDLNKDELQDLVVVNKGSGNLTVLPSFANGDNFQVAESKAIYYNVGPDPFRVWSYDLDQDDCPDLVVAHEATSAYSWLRNPACDGNLLAAVDSPMPVDPKNPGTRLDPLKFGVADVDLEPDQFDDVVLLTERIDVEEPAAGGGTTTAKHYPLWFYRSRGAAGDGVESSARDAGLLPSDFAAAVTDLVLGNVAKSSHPDLLISFLTPGATAPAPDPDNPQPPAPVVSRVAIAAMTWSTAGLVGKFESLFQSASPEDEGAEPTVPFYADPVAIALGTVSTLTPPNMVDFVTVHAEKGAPGSPEYRSPMLVSYQVNSSGTGAPFIQRDIKVGAEAGVGRGPADAVMGVFINKNDLNDVLVANRENQDLSVFRGMNQGKFANAIPAFGIGADPLAVAPVYWNDDCFLDIAILTSDNLAIAYWNDAAGVFEPAAYFYGEDLLTSLTEGQDLIRGAVDFLVSDTNHDCRDDLVVLNKNRSQILVYTSSGQKAPGDGLPASPVIFPTGSGPIQLAKGRLNDDTCDDLAVLNGRGESFTVLISTGCTECTPVVCP